MQITYDRHILGVAIFSMEAFEYKNFTSKRIVLHWTKRRGNICKQSLRVLQLYFQVSTHNAEAEMKERGRKRAKINSNRASKAEG